MRILHLAYEDPAQPGSGGGSVRTREINRRLSDRHEITALVANYPGARPRHEDGIRWIPVGPRTGGKLDRLAYFALLAPAIRRYAHDLLVEDFGAPFSVGLAPLWTRKPVVASVQWLFASEMRAKYHLPFDWVEHSGLHLYHNFIAVSDWLAHRLRARRQQAQIAVIPNGVERAAFDVTPRSPQHLLYVGRLDVAQKGCDLLILSMARARTMLGTRLPPLVIVGDGPDRLVIERMVDQHHLRDHVTFVGRVEGSAKYRLMADAYALLMPSRWETFGMVAAEGLAASAPVVAFDVGPLRDVAGPGGARLVPAFDVDAFARELVALVDDPPAAQRALGRRWAQRYDWDAIAAQQEAWYVQAVEQRHPPARRLFDSVGTSHTTGNDGKRRM